MQNNKLIERIASSQMTRADLMRLKKNATTKLKQGESSAQSVIDAIDCATPADPHILFMGFCPGGNVAERLDGRWKAKGICEFDFINSASQLKEFQEVMVGDLVILKKIEEYGVSMGLNGHGRVTDTYEGSQGVRQLYVDWADQDDVIIVPLMGCNSTVNVKDIGKVDQEMPQAFWDWLGTSA